MTMNKAKMEKNLEKVKEVAEEEVKKVKKELLESIRKTQSFMRKNPEKIAMISAGIGATVGAFLTKLAVSKKKTAQKTKKK